jgi:glycerol-3-phosphate dehydrogenase
MGSLCRSENLGRLRDGATWDVVVIGGGATGLGAAVDAVARGYRTLVLEARDFAHGTSSRSTKLIHGGVRYLAQGNIALVREALHERGVLLRNAPHLVHPREFVVAAYRFFDLPFYGTGLKLYDLLAGRNRIERSHWIRRKDVIGRLPTIRAEGLRGGIVYADCQFDDARLAIALARTVVDLGGTALNYAPVTGLIKQDGRISGVRVQDSESHESFEISARSVINAAGVYVDSVRRLDNPSSSQILAPSQGAHLVLDRSFLPGASALMVPKTDDGRVLFVIPWHNRLLVGTTDTPIASLPAEPQPLGAEIEFLLAHVARYLDKRPQPSDILSTFAGLRPLLRGGRRLSTAKLSREHAVFVSSAGLVTITGGKWTTYRRMASDAVSQAAMVGGLSSRPAATAELKLHGWNEADGREEDSMAAYGSDAPALAAVFGERPDWNVQLHPRLPYRTGEVVWAARHETARTIEDVLARRTRALFLDAGASIEAAPVVAAILAAELKRDQAWQDSQVEDYRKLANGYLPS